MDLQIPTNTSIDHPGSRFYLDPAIRPRQSSGEKMRILVVEDDSMQRLILVSLLTRHGHDVIAVSDGNAAWQELERNSLQHCIHRLDDAGNERPGADS